jgi:predicted Zn finger-like uncharacterized protein
VKISCPACAAKYSIADEKVQDRLAKIRCRKCGTTIVIDGKVSPPHVYAAEGSAADHGHAAAPAGGDGAAAGEYSVDFGDNDQRTMALGDIIAAYNAGQLTAESFVWAEGMTDWKPLGEVAEIVDALHVAASRPSAPVPSSPPAAAPWDAPRQSDAAIARAAVSRPGGGRGHTSDLFGGFEHAGSEHDVTTSAPDDGGGHAMAAGASATGARNESSVLFSLSALTAAAKPSSPAAATSAPSLFSSSASSSASASKSKGEDSGLIDLKALTAASKPEHDAPAPVLGAPPLGVAPLGFAPLGGRVDASPIEMPQSKNRTGMVIAVGIVLAAVVLGAMFILRPAPPPPAPPPVAAAPAPTPTPTPTPTEAVTAKPPATGTAAEAEEKKPAAVAGKYRPRGGGGAAKKTAGDAPASGGGGDKPAAAAPKKPAGNKCGCAPTDLMCNMKCSAK